MFLFLKKIHKVHFGSEDETNCDGEGLASCVSRWYNLPTCPRISSKFGVCVILLEIGRSNKSDE